MRGSRADAFWCRSPRRSSRCGRALRPGACLAALVLGLGSPAAAETPRERAVGRIPELMGRILESQEEIRSLEQEAEPVVAGYERRLGSARERIQQAGSEEDAFGALVDYVEAYSSRIEAQEQVLQAIGAPVARMRADARELHRAAGVVGDGDREESASPEEREQLLQAHFQGVAYGIQQLAQRLDRDEEAGTVGRVLRASWASQTSLSLPLAEFDDEGAELFARRVEGLYARYQARANQLRAEKLAVRRLLDVLIERQLSQRLGDLFAGDESLGGLLSADGKSDGWEDLSQVVSRVMDLPSARPSALQDGASLDQLDYFASGGHRR